MFITSKVIHTENLNTNVQLEWNFEMLMNNQSENRPGE